MTPEHLIATGWRQTRSGRWTHPTLPTLHGRLRTLTLADALGYKLNGDETDQAHAELATTGAEEASA